MKCLLDRPPEAQIVLWYKTLDIEQATRESRTRGVFTSGEVCGNTYQLLYKRYGTVRVPSAPKNISAFQFRGHGQRQYLLV